MGVCSDASAGHSTDEIGDFTELEIPVTTDPECIGEALSKSYQDVDVLVVFSTYHSIRLISDAQRSAGAPPFDLMFCDEAHRTTGAQIISNKAGDKRGTSVFLMAHDNRHVQAKKRVYMTATPKIWSTKSDNSYQNAEVFSMDDENQFGPVFYRMKFSEAIDKRLLSDYYLVGLTINPAWKNQVSQLGLDPDLPPSEQAKLYGAVKGVAFDENDVPHLRRSLSFTNTIKRSKKHQLSIEVASERLKEIALDKNGDAIPFRVRTQHIDGKTKANIRRQYLDWLKEPEEDECRIVTNARCLSEGVDVPNLDAALFMSPKHSAIDIVQQVGRVMRKSPNKTHGYIVVPILLAEGETATDALQKSEDYATIIKVVRALRSHDDNIDELINQKRFGEKLRLVPVPEPFGERDNELTSEEEEEAIQEAMFAPDDLIEALNVLVFEDCGDRQYWAKWAKDVGEQTVELQNNILVHLKTSEHARERFDQFMTGIHETMSPNMTEQEAAGMLAQHLVTQPVFDAFFENYEFSRHNPVSQIMNDVIEEIIAQDLLSDLQHSLAPFYESVQKRIRGITDSTTRHEVLKELYETFLKTAFPDLTDLLGVVYTPVEIVDWLLHSADDALRQEFGFGLGDKEVEILDPFSGTGTFLTRLIESDLIPDGNLDYKYQNELSAIDILPTAYYLSAINIEEAYHGRKMKIEDKPEYKPFPGIALSDTFTSLNHNKDLRLGQFGIEENNTPTINAINRKDIKVIVGNPPWRTGQKDATFQNPNPTYESLDNRITNTYALRSSATRKGALYDMYLKSLRWASDRLSSRGVIALVTNGGWLEGNAANGVRYCLADEFASVYCYNLRGRIMTTPEEGKNVFNVKVPVTLLILVKNDIGDTSSIYYTHSKDNLTKEAKLEVLKSEKSLTNANWEPLIPDRNSDWINQSNENYQKYQPIGSKDTRKYISNAGIFRVYSSGIITGRDPWAYNSNQKSLAERTKKMIDFYNHQISVNTERPEHDNTIIKWHRESLKHFHSRRKAEYSEKDFRVVMRRPFFPQTLHYDLTFNNTHYQMDKLFPTNETPNLAIMISGTGVTEFDIFMTNRPTDLNFARGGGQAIPRIYYHFSRKSNNKTEQKFFDHAERYVVEDNVLDETLISYQEYYGDDRIEKDDIFYYVYGILHHPTYTSKYRNDLSKGLPRIPKVPDTPDFWAFAKAGRKLGHLHVGYSELDGYPLEQQHSVLFDLDNDDHYRFEKLKKTVKDDDTVEIRINEHLTLTDIPRRVLDYKVNGRSGLDWIVTCYRIHEDARYGSGIVNDANQLFDDPRDFIKLVEQVVQVSVESVDIIESLPEFELPEAR